MLQEQMLTQWFRRRKRYDRRRDAGRRRADSDGAARRAWSRLNVSEKALYMRVEKEGGT
jgi:hypothetical protein